MLLEAIRVAAEVGPVIPLSPTHKPLIAFAGMAKTADEVRKLWSAWPSAGIGVHAASAGLLIIDVENPAKRPGTPDGSRSLDALTARLGWLPKTLTHRTKSGGWHYVFRASNGPRSSQGWLRGGLPCPGVDIVAGNAILRWPPTGGYRRVDGPSIAAELPQKWAQAMTEQQKEELPIQWQSERGLHAYVRRVLAIREEELSSLSSGRSVALNAVAYSLGRWSPPLRTGAIEEALVRASKANGAYSEHGARACLSTIRRGIAAGAKRPKAGILR